MVLVVVRLWTPDEVRLAISLYVQIPFGRIDYRNSEIIELAQRIGRTPSSVALKLANFAALDETLPRSGMQNVSKLDREIWSEFFQALLRELPSNEEYAQEPLTLHEPFSEYLHDGISLDRFAISKQRLRQDLFRTMVLSAYDYRCAVTGIEQPELLVAGHIKPWALDISQRLNPSNGICLNRLHDRAFDKGLITFEDNGELMFSPQIRPGTREKMLIMGGTSRLRPPRRFLPDRELLRFHRERIFIASA